MRRLTGHRHAVRAVTYSPGSGILASAGDDRRILFWDPSTGTELALMESRRDGILCLTFSPDGKQIVTGGRSGSIQMWDVATHTRLPGIDSCTGPVVAIAYTLDARALLSAVRDYRSGQDLGQILCSNLDPYHPTQALDWTGDLACVAFSPTRDVLAIANSNRGVELWPIGRPQREPDFWAGAGVRSMAFSPDERLLAVAEGRVIQLWDMSHRCWVRSYKGHRGDVFTVAFSPDGRLLLSGGIDRSVRLWEVQTGREQAAWNWDIGVVRTVAFSPDGMTAAAGGDRPVVAVWDIE